MWRIHISVLPFQSTPAHGGRPVLTVEYTFATQVSIHARAWRATRRSAVPSSAQRVSIHARAWRATGFAPLLWSKPICFNPRPRMAGDFCARNCPCSLRCFNPRPRMAGDQRHGVATVSPLVSIHARAWRATLFRCQGEPKQQVSIHARAWRATERPYRLIQRI